ncbi:hypothetical protein [Maritimibacter sp. UBA3975]|uniref:hypothetical protein n=1 Tax=Maritimibacter sp. UBA3975 TaxID=1946833 RepID=UPI000C0942D1|nr:hypothetical protein [Maritimibacter sp. UBA3975]MAM60841.1 hypothetical protein [Maritimibacter sp.]|tara:strand:- start:1157 stop:1351 length:195 start_codon:yes stop_codon:yes gene_type:complete
MTAARIRTRLDALYRLRTCLQRRRDNWQPGQHSRLRDLDAKLRTMTTEIMGLEVELAEKERRVA